MKDNKLFSAIGNIDEELINEAVNTTKTKKLLFFRITASAAAFVFIALAAAFLVNINKQPNMIAESNTSNVQTAEKADSTKPESKEQKNESTVSALNGDNSIKTSDTQTSKTPQPDNQPSKTKKTNAEGNSDFTEQPTVSTPVTQTDETEQPTVSTPSEQTSEIEQPATSTSETQTSEQTSIEHPADEDEGSDMLGFIVTDDGKTYMQVLNNTEYTLDKDIGRAGDFNGYYSNLEDNSRVYTVKEDDNILVVKFEDGGSVTLMLWDEDVQDRMGYYRFNNLRVDRSLMAALFSNDGKAYSVYVTRPDSDDMYDYVYNGRTLKEISDEIYECQKTEAILQWISGQITDNIFLSGRDDAFLEEALHIKETYRISGTDTYDTEKAKEDSLSYSFEYKNLYNEYQAALDAFLKEKIKAIYDILIANGIQAELINGVRCEMTITKEQFEALAASGSISDEYVFGLSAGNYFVDDTEA